MYIDCGELAGRAGPVCGEFFFYWQGPLYLEGLGLDRFGHDQDSYPIKHAAARDQNQTVGLAD